MFRPTAPIRTARLLLRPFSAADLDDVWSYQRLPEVTRHLRYEPRNREQSRESLGRMIRERELVKEGDCLSLAVVWPEVGAVVGHVELVWLSEQKRRGELGWIFHPRYQGRGLATEAARELLRLGFDELALHRISARCAAENVASARVMERLGMRREAHFVESELVKGAWRDELVYAMLRREWDELSGARGGVTHHPATGR